jgi:hypothetical protein
MLTFAERPGRLLTLTDGYPDEEFLPESDVRFFSTDRDRRITFQKDANGEVTGFLVKEGGRERIVPRIGPLFHSLTAQTDPDPSRTNKVLVALRALYEGGKAIAECEALTPGARTDFAGPGHSPILAGLQSLRFLADKDASAKKIERHHGEVRRILHYRLATDKGDRFVLAYLTPDGRITDYDVVDD